MAQSTRPASANGSARQDTRAAGRPARSSADGAVRSLPEPRPRAQAMALPGRSRRQPCTRGWKPSPPPGSAKSGAARIGWARAGPPWRTPARISSMICGSTCAGCARCPTCCHGRQARAHASRAAQGSGLGHAAAVAGARLGRLHDGSAAAALRCRSGYRSASRARSRSRRDRARRDVRQPADRTLPGHAAPAPGTQRGDPRRHGRARAPVAVSRARPPPRGWDAALRARLDNAADQGRGASMRRGSASNACAMPARRCCCSVHPASSSATSRPWPTCRRAGQRAGLPYSRRAGARCVSACRPAGWRVG